MLRIIEALYELLGVEKQKGENSPEQRVKYIMSKLDKNQNGSLNEQEFVEGCLSN
jgi:Ca2+-binding EF-hand superfamily protein